MDLKQSASTRRIQGRGSHVIEEKPAASVDGGVSDENKSQYQNQLRKG